jgi:type VI secretion system protein ImpA
MAADVSNSTPEVIEIEALLTPISEENPVGEDMKYSNEYAEIREARRSEDAIDQGEWKRDLKVADWSKVIDLSTDLLSSKTKDLQIAVWLSEALVRIEDFPGLRDGLKVVRGLHERFWDNFYPEIDDGDLEARANVLAWMDRQLASAIKDVPITKGSGGLEFTYLDFEDSKRFDIPENLENLDSDAIARAEALRAQAAEEGRVTSEDWRKARNTTSAQFYKGLHEILTECWEEFQSLDRVMDDTFKNQTPGLGSLKKSLDEVRTYVEKTAREKGAFQTATATTSDGNGVEVVGEDGETVIGAAGVGVGVSGPVRSRQEALKRLTEVANYFKQTEPHSPVSYLVQRAVKWGEMPLDSWLAEVIKDQGVLDQLRDTLGINNNSYGSE